jgi:hypothetical protein
VYRSYRLRDDPHWRPVALVDTDATALSAASAFTGLGEAFCFAGLQDALATVEADAVVVITPSGLPLTEESPVDHPHHNSIWIGQDDLDGHNFWLVEPGCGHIAGEVSHAVEGQTAVFREHSTWIAPHGEKVLVEDRVTRITPAPPGQPCHVLDIDSRRITAGPLPVRFGQTKEADLGIRLLQQLDGEDGGTIEDAAGRRGETETFDQVADWVDYSGIMAGHRVGLCILPHPSNPPQAWFTREYGIVVWNHVRRAPAVLVPGVELRLRFRLLAHDGSPHEAGVADHHAAFCLLGSEEL